ncbi:hypothetical protein HDK90DRAFT_331133 [Phyllosticta capitalensis]|uniref:Uncharacterized protein n=1 Tax=Phyllosticta capitalensis TaxID=121624 RepID=A0ABR1YIJ0_9PEZI
MVPQPCELTRCQTAERFTVPNRMTERRSLVDQRPPLPPVSVESKCLARWCPTEWFRESTIWLRLDTRKLFSGHMLRSGWKQLPCGSSPTPTLTAFIKTLTGTGDAHHPLKSCIVGESSPGYVAGDRSQEPLRLSIRPEVVPKFTVQGSIKRVQGKNKNSPYEDCSSYALPCHFTRPAAPRSQHCNITSFSWYGRDFPVIAIICVNLYDGSYPRFHGRYVAYSMVAMGDRSTLSGEFSTPPLLPLLYGSSSFSSLTQPLIKRPSGSWQWLVLLSLIIRFNKRAAASWGFGFGLVSITSQ